MMVCLNHLFVCLCEYSCRYLGVAPNRKLKVLVNPKGGPVSPLPEPVIDKTHSSILQGKAKGIFEKRVKPILEAARCVLDIECALHLLLSLTPIPNNSLLVHIVTTHRFHAQEIAQALPLEYDAIVALSGDGLLHEILNGLAMRADVAKAIHTPVVPVPTGSANGFNLNLQGLEACHHLLVHECMALELTIHLHRAVWMLAWLALM